MRDQLEQLLHKYDKLGSEVASQLIDLFTPKFYPAGTLLAKPGAITSKVAYIHSGIIQHYLLGTTGEEIIMDFHTGPDITAYSITGFFMTIPSQIYCKTITDVDLLEVNDKEVFALADKNPSLYEFLLSRVTEVYQDRQIKEFSIIEKTSKERYVEFSEENPELMKNISLKSIASYLDIQPGSLSRIRKNLRK